MGKGWVYDEGSRRYRNAQTGRYLSNAQMLDLRNDFAERMHQEVLRVTERLTSGEYPLSDWEAWMRKLIKLTLVDEYVLGLGGRKQMTFSDWGKLGSLARSQYEYLSGFAQDIASGRYLSAEGTLDLEAIAGRAGLYMNAGCACYERARAKALGAPDLPFYPGDGSTPCLTNCKCHWEIEEGEDGWLITWVLGDADHCEGCEGNAAAYNRLPWPARPEDE